MIEDVPTLINAIDPVLDGGHSDPDRVYAARLRLQEALSCTEFITDCVSRVLASFATSPRPWKNPPLLERPGRGIQVRVIYWPPGYVNPPHEHRTWTLTGILHNRLQIRSLRHKVGDVLMEHSFDGWRGATGYLLPPCIHTVRNPTERPSASLHVFSYQPGSDATNVELDEAKGARWFQGSRRGEILKGAAKRALLTNVEILALLPRPQAVPLLEMIFSLGDVSIRLAAGKAMCRLDLELGLERLRALANGSPENDRERLLTILRQIHSTRCEGRSI